MATDLEKYTKDLYAAFNARDLETFLSFHTDDVIVNMPDGTIIRGMKDVRDGFKSFLDAFSDIRVDLTSRFSAGNRQCEEYILSARHTGDYRGMPATGRSFSYRVAAVRELREGKTSQLSSYYDSATMMRQLGVLRPTTSREPRA